MQAQGIGVLCGPKGLGEGITLGGAGGDRGQFDDGELQGVTPTVCREGRGEVRNLARRSTGRSSVRIPFGRFGPRNSLLGTEERGTSPPVCAPSRAPDVVTRIRSALGGVCGQRMVRTSHAPMVRLVAGTVGRPQAS